MSPHLMVDQLFVFRLRRFARNTLGTHPRARRAMVFSITRITRIVRSRMRARRGVPRSVLPCVCGRFHVVDVPERGSPVPGGTDARQDDAANAGRHSSGMEHLPCVLSGNVVGRLFVCACDDEVAGTNGANHAAFDSDFVAAIACGPPPLHLPAGWEPPAQNNPAPWILGVLLVAVGLPFFVLFSNTPIMQRWLWTDDYSNLLSVINWK